MFTLSWLKKYRNREIPSNAVPSVTIQSMLEKADADALSCWTVAILLLCQRQTINNKLVECGGYSSMKVRDNRDRSGPTLLRQRANRCFGASFQRPIIFFWNPALECWAGSNLGHLISTDGVGTSLGMPRGVYYTDGNREEHLYSASCARQTSSKHSTGPILDLPSSWAQILINKHPVLLYKSSSTLWIQCSVYMQSSLSSEFSRGGRPSHPPEMGWLIFPRQVYLSEVPTRSQTAVMTEL